MGTRALLLASAWFSQGADAFSTTNLVLQGRGSPATLVRSPSRLSASSSPWWLADLSLLRRQNLWEQTIGGMPKEMVLSTWESLVSSLPSEVQAMIFELARSSESRGIALIAIGTTAAMIGSGVWLLADLAEKQEISPVTERPYPDGTYDRVAAAQYFSRRPARSLARGLEIMAPALRFGLDLALSPDNRESRERLANLLVDYLTRLGPTFIKVGQALSIRSDLLPAEYCDALASLQDKVPPFETNLALDLIKEELGRVNELFVGSFPDKPIASASLGQVYKASVDASLLKPFDQISKSDERPVRDVAVKVQRPGVVETIALDLHLLRTAAPIARGVFRLNTDLPGLVDAWGEKFVDELDYTKEAENAKRFTQSISSTPLAGVVFAPAPIASCSSRRVLTTEWVDGERLDATTEKAKISALCSIAMNAYLTMMLETGVLHADPHPGNLLVEKGTNRLAILDWGLVTTLEPGLRVTYIEHIAHLVAKDYKKVPADLVKLGFVPEGYEEQIESSDAVKVISDVYTQFAGGGGAAKIDVPAVLDQLRGLADRQGNLFRLPPYFAYIARAFSVLEGIGLRNDPDYAIVQECLPYVSQRLVTDPSPRVAMALETFVYDNARRVDADRLEYLLDGLGSYAKSVDGPSDDDDDARLGGLDEDSVLQTARRLADLLFPQAGPSPTQAIVEREIAKLAGATVRSAAASLRDRPSALAFATLLDPLGLFEPLARGPLLQPDIDDEAALAVFARVQTKASPQLSSALQDFAQLPPDTRERILREFVRIIWERRRPAFDSARRVSQQLAQQTADRLLNRPEISNSPPPQT